MCFRKKISTLPIILLACLPPSLHAQINDIEHERLSIEHGLPHNSIYSILQDSQGFMWFGTRDGLARYDGYSFKIYKHDPADSTSLSNSWVFIVYEDRFNTLWISTENGLNKFDRVSETFTHYRSDPNDFTKLSAYLVPAIYEDRSGTFWLGNMRSPDFPLGGLYQFDRQTGHLTRYKHEPDNPNSLSDNAVRCIVEDDSGSLWIGTEQHGLNRLVLSEAEGLVLATQTFTRYRHEPGKPNSLSDDQVWFGIKDREGELWFGTFGGGLNRYDPATDGFVHYKHDPNDRNSLHENAIQSLFLDSSGMIWIGNGVLSRFDPRTDSFTHQRFSKSQHDWKSSYAPWPIYEDKSHNLWVGTAGSGVFKIDLKPRKFTHYRHDPDNANSLSDDDIRLIHEGRDGVFWIGTRQDGLNCFDPETGRFTHFKHDPHNARTLSSNIIEVLYEDHAGAIWVGTPTGLNRFEPSSHSFTRYVHDPHDPFSISDNAIETIYESRYNGAFTLWVGTYSGGLNELVKREKNGADARLETFIHYKIDPDADHDSRINDIEAIHEDRLGHLWLRSRSAGLLLFDRGSKKFMHVSYDWGLDFFEDSKGRIWGRHAGLNKLDVRKKQFVRYRIVENEQRNESFDMTYNHITTIYEAESGRLWCGGRYGLHLFDPETNQFIRHYYEKDGLPSNLIYKIIGDDCGNLWIVTGSGLCIFNENRPPGQKFKRFDNKEGIVNSASMSTRGAFIKSKSGDIYWGGNNGIYRFHTAVENTNPNIPAIQLTEFKLFHHTVNLDTAISERKTIRLEHDQNFFTFGFAALDFTNPNLNRYAYKLQGFDSDWIASGSKREANYTNVPPGEYIFRVKGSNNDGVWNEAGASVQVIIASPFWQRWWFRGLAALVVIAMLAALHRYRVSRVLEVERTRDRIARDLHDEIGSSLSSIALTAEMIEEEPSIGDRARKQLHRIQAGATSLIEVLRDIVWSVDPEHDRLDDLLLHMKDVAHELLSQAKIPYHLHFPKTEFVNKLSMEFRHNLFLTYKELLHNICKHSGATEVDISLEKSDGQLILKVTDNGHGFDPAKTNSGNGLKSIRARSKEIKAHLAIESAVGLGTTVTLTTKIP